MSKKIYFEIYLEKRAVEVRGEREKEDEIGQRDHAEY